MKDKKESSNEPTQNESQTPQTSQSPQDQQDHQAPQVPSAPAVTDNGTTATPPETGAPSPSDIPAGETGAPNPEDLNTGSDATKTEEATEQIEFTKKVLPSEKIHYENVIAANKKTIAALRTENIGLRNEIKALTEGPEASEE